MSISNYNVSVEDSEGSVGRNNANDRNGFQEYHVQNMYETEGFKNKHDIAGVKGIVKTQTDEINNKKVTSYMACL